MTLLAETLPKHLNEVGQVSAGKTAGQTMFCRNIQLPAETTFMFRQLSRVPIRDGKWPKQ